MKKKTIENKILFDVEYIFIDGISRSGKGAIVPFVSSLKGVEHWKQNFNLEKLLFLLETGEITEEGFRYFFETDLIMDTWFSMLGRNVNTNKHDISSVLNATNPDKYLQRFNQKDTQEVFNQIKREIEDNKFIFTYLTDDFIFQHKLVKKIVPKSKFVVSIRHPIEIIFAWERSGRGKRFGTDQRFLNPTFTYSGCEKIPYFALDFAQEYSNGNSTERCVMSINELQRSYNKIFKYKFVDHMFIDFDKFVVDPQNYINELANFIGKNKLENYEALQKKCRLPRPMDPELHSRKAEVIFSSIGQKYREMLIALCEEHERLYSNSYKVNYSDFLDIKFKKADFTSITAEPKYVRGNRIN